MMRPAYPAGRVPPTAGDAVTNRRATARAPAPPLVPDGGDAPR
jgi:hypothetical protein